MIRSLSLFGLNLHKILSLSVVYFGIANNTMFGFILANYIFKEYIYIVLN